MVEALAMIHLDPTVSWGNVLTILSLLIMGATALLRSIRHDAVNTERMEMFRTLLAKQDERITKTEDLVFTHAHQLAEVTGFCRAQHDLTRESVREPRRS